MEQFLGKVVLITGASSGIGKAIAATLTEPKYRVYGTSRFTQQDTENIRMLQLDVRNDESIKSAISKILEKEGRIDVVINNAGFGIAGAVEDTSIEEAMEQFNTNFFGVHRVCRQILPVMREQKSGLIVNIGSIAGLIAIPFQSMYSASKHALEAMTESLRIEVEPYGIKVVLVEPGDTATNFTNRRKFVQNSKSSVYKNRFERSIHRMIQDEIKGSDPSQTAKAVLRLLESNHPPIRMIIGWKNKFFVLLKRILPSWLTELILKKLYG